jgi:hypothetical protein
MDLTRVRHFDRGPLGPFATAMTHILLVSISASHAYLSLLLTSPASRCCIYCQEHLARRVTVTVLALAG